MDGIGDSSQGGKAKRKKVEKQPGSWSETTDRIMHLHSEYLQFVNRKGIATFTGITRYKGPEVPSKPLIIDFLENIKEGAALFEQKEQLELEFHAACKNVASSKENALLEINNANDMLSKMEDNQEIKQELHLEALSLKGRLECSKIPNWLCLTLSELGCGDADGNQSKPVIVT